MVLKVILRQAFDNEVVLKVIEMVLSKVRF